MGEASKRLKTASTVRQITGETNNLGVGWVWRGMRTQKLLEILRFK